MSEQNHKSGLAIISESIDKAYNETQLSVIKNTVAKGTNNSELAYFIYTAQSVGLNPLNREIWCYKDNRNNLIVFAGRDGFLKKAQSDPRWNGIVSSEVRANDYFEVDIPNGKITHKPNYKEDRGDIIGAYCKVKPKDSEIATIEWADFKTYDKKYNTWKTHPAEMVKKVAETHALKKAFGISGLQSEYDFDVKGQTVEPVDTNKSELDQKRDEFKEALEAYQGEDKEKFRQTAKNMVAGNEETVQNYDNLIKQMQNES